MHTFLEFLYILNRYIHIVCTTVIVGGTLFYELIVPVAIGELKQEQQLSVFGRARWSFRTVVIACAVLMVISGIVSTVRLWTEYTGGEHIAQMSVKEGAGAIREVTSDVHRPGWWWAGHASMGVVALVVAVSLMTVRRPPEYPLYWMRLSLTILLVVIFFATTSRYMRLSIYEAEHAAAASKSRPME